MKYLKQKFIKNFKPCQRIIVMVAHKYENGYWSGHTLHNYVVSKVDNKRISCYNADHDYEWLDITRKDLDSGYLIIEL